MSFLKLVQVQHPTNGKMLDMVLTPGDAVAVLIFCRDTWEMLFVEQVRPAMMSKDNPTGRITEIPAGRIEQDEEAVLCAVREVEEETKIGITPDRVKVLNNGKFMAFCPGITPEKVALFYVEIEESDLEKYQTVFGRADEGEETTLVRVKFSDVFSDKYEFADLKTFAACMWFYKEYLQGNVLGL